MEGSWIPADFSACLFEHWINPPKKKNKTNKIQSTPKTEPLHMAQDAESGEILTSTSTLLHWLNRSGLQDESREKL